MNTETMTVHRALVELKTLNSRIEKEIYNATFVIATKHSNNKINGKDTVDDFCKNVKDVYSSIQTLINRRAALKQAVVQSNAVTKITVCNKEYTIAEAIEAKNNTVQMLKTLAETINIQYTKANQIVTKENGDKLTQAADSFIASMYGGKDKAAKSDEATTARNSYITANSYDLIDPLNAVTCIKELENFYTQFYNDIDAALSVSNATTVVEFSYDVI